MGNLTKGKYVTIGIYDCAYDGNDDIPLDNLVFENLEDVVTYDYTYLLTTEECDVVVDAMYAEMKRQIELILESREDTVEIESYDPFAPTYLDGEN